MRAFNSRGILIVITGIALLSFSRLNAQYLKSVVYDFDGFDLNATSLPEGDYKYGDLTYQTVSDPLSTNSDVLGDRVLRMDLKWVNGYAAFGRGISRFVEMDAAKDVLNFYFYNPASNSQAATIEITIADDDNDDQSYANASDDSWEKVVSITGAAGWQLISIPVKDFSDGNTGGNGVFDVGFSPARGMLLLVEFRFNKASSSLTDAVFYIDMICFSEGTLPRGNSILQPPVKSNTDHCYLGAHRKELPGEYYKVPQNFEGQFPAAPARKIKYAHSYMQWGTDGTAAAKALPGAGFQTLINNGYTPILTWEPQFKGFSSLDPVQPRLDDIINGDYNSFIDDFANKMKLYTDTIIIRFMHEFDGDWYPWCISQNGEDPAKFALAFKTVVQRFKAKGATKVKWMWCPNNSYKPNSSYNYAVLAYPGDSFVDIVGTDIYNSHYPADVPWWRSFRWQTTEIYYYFVKNFPSKPIFICELACRERLSSEMTSSQSKAGWFEQMDSELQTYFNKVRAIVFFDEYKDQTWNISSSATALQSLTTHIWNDDYYFGNPQVPTPVTAIVEGHRFSIYPNPSSGSVKVGRLSGTPGEAKIEVKNIAGQLVRQILLNGTAEVIIDLDPGVYLLEISTVRNKEVRKIIIN
jgi:hypothetical protein